MKKIVLLCNLGMSTSVLVNKMKESAKNIGYEAIIEAYPIGELESKAKDADCILVGPQIRYALSQVTAAFPEKPIETIDMLDYGMVNGEKVLKQAVRLIENNK